MYVAAAAAARRCRVYGNARLFFEVHGGLFCGDIAIFFSFKCRLGLPVVREVSSVVTMKSIDMYILHDSRSVVVHDVASQFQQAHEQESGNVGLDCSR